MARRQKHHPYHAARVQKTGQTRCWDTMVLSSIAWAPGRTGISRPACRSPPALQGQRQRHGDGQADRADLAEERQSLRRGDVGSSPDIATPGQRQLGLTDGSQAGDGAYRTSMS